MNQLATNPLSAPIEVVVNGLPVTYYECGRGEPLLLLHGWPQTSYIWRKVLPALAKRYRVLAVDLPGMGNNYAMPTSDTQTIAAFLKAWCDQLGLLIAAGG